MTRATAPSPARDDVRERDSVLTWLDAFAAAVRAADYDAGRDLFDPDAVGFGTFTRMAVGRANLIEEQWKRIWSCTRGFRFITEEAHMEVQDDLAWIATPWVSQGRDEAGQWFDRLGRATLILRRSRDAWLCVHSHYSRVPTPKLGGHATPA